MKLNVCWKVKDTEIDTRTCVVSDVIILSENEFNKFKENLMGDYDFIRNNRDSCFWENGCDYVLLILGENQKDGILVDTEGSNYARCTSYLPNARELLKNEIKQLADYCISEGLQNTEYGKWSISYNELYYHFNNTIVTDNNGIGKMLIDELSKRDEINELIMTEDCIEMSYHMEYCNVCQQGGVLGAMTLFSLMGCNLYDVHLCDKDEDHELATIVELNKNTLTDEGKKDWSDVLSAKVESIYNGYYGTQIGLSGCDAQRISAFSFMLAGHCSAEDYDRWVNDDTQTKTMEQTM